MHAMFISTYCTMTYEVKVSLLALIKTTIEQLLIIKVFLNTIMKKWEVGDIHVHVDGMTESKMC